MRHFQLLQALPEQGVGAGVAGEDPPAGIAAVDGEADGGHGVRSRQHLDALAGGFDHLAHLDGRQREDGLLGARQAREVGPDHAVEDVRAQRSESLGQGMDADRALAGLAARPHDAVGEQADGKDVVEVRVADEDVLDARQGVERQVADAGAGVDEDVVVDQEGRGPASGRDGA